MGIIYKLLIELIGECEEGMKYNVLYISNGATLGGAEQSLLDTLKEIKNRDVIPVVIIPQQGILEMQLQMLDIRYYIIPFENGYCKIGEGSKLKRKDNFRNNFFAALQLQEIIRKENIDIIHINSSTSNTGALAALIAEIPYIWHFREFLEEDFSAEFLDKRLKEKLVDYADLVITISDSVKQKYKKEYGFESVQIYNGIDSSRYKNELTGFITEKKQHNFLISGVISQNKGQWDAIKAVEYLVNEDITNVHLTLLGSGKESFLWIISQYIQKKHLEDYIDIIPFQVDLSQHRRAVQYSITTSKMEALGRCTIEAMFAGNIVIGADTGGTREIIGEDESRGYLYRQGDYKDLAKVMKKAILANKQKKADCRKNAQEFVESVFSLEKYVNKLCYLYTDVLRKRNSNNDKNRKEFIKYLYKRYNNVCEARMMYVNSEIIDNYKRIINLWEQTTNKGHSLSRYLLKYNYRKIALYGMGDLGCKVFKELADTEVEIVYVVDKSPQFINEVFRVLSPEDIMPAVDLLLITVANEEEGIVKRYRNKYSFPVMGVSELLDEILLEEKYKEEKNEKGNNSYFFHASGSICRSRYRGRRNSKGVGT